MTLTAEFNFKAKLNRRESAETDTFGGRALSRYFCSLSYRTKVEKKVEPTTEIKIVEIPVPVRAVRAPLWRM